MKKIIEGCIDEVHDGLVIATLIDSSGWTYYAEIDLDRFADAEQAECVPGRRFTIREPGPELRLRKKEKCQCGLEGCCS